MPRHGHPLQRQHDRELDGRTWGSDGGILIDAIVLGRGDIILGRGDIILGRRDVILERGDIILGRGNIILGYAAAPGRCLASSSGGGAGSSSSNTVPVDAAVRQEVS